ncbi:MAG TPA: adenylate/guanylate cyclase domain-containing protein [Fimbriimonadaceae bacterium]|nr:adenylate/guanylate cyclase domain-containing protein [Fimbriimonadaceae bacterium]
MRVSTNHTFVALRIALVVLAVVLGFAFPLTKLGTRLELNYWDHFVSSNPISPSNDIVILEATEESMKALGPDVADRRIVPREIMAETIRILDRLRPRVLAIDVWFDPALNRTAPKETSDLVTALRSFKSPLVCAVRDGDEDAHGQVRFDLPFFAFEIPEAHLGHTTVIAEIDEIARAPEGFLWDEERSIWHPHISLMAYSLARGVGKPVLDQGHGVAKVGHETISLGDFGSLPLRYSSRGAIKLVEIQDFLVMAKDPNQSPRVSSLFSDKIVVLSGFRETDIHNTPLGRRPGSEIVASAINTLLEGSSSKSLRYSGPLLLAWISLLALMSVAVTAAARHVWVGIGVLAICGLTWLMPQWAYSLVRIEFSAPALAVAVSLLGGFSIEITRSRLIPLARPPQEATVLFVDVRGSTSLVTDKGIKIVGELMEKVFRVLSKAIRETGGEVERTTGDGVMVVFRRNGERSSAESCLASIQPIQREIQKINEWFEERHGSTVEVRMGIESGEIATMIIEGRGMEPSSVGGAVNLAARLLALAQEEGHSVLLGPRTQQMAGAQFVVRFVGDRELKGFEGTVPVFEFVGVTDTQEGSARRPARR